MAALDLSAMSLSESRILEISSEFVQLKKLDLFDNKEINDIMTKIMQFQSKINGKDHCIAYCVEYIEYQIHLLKTIQLRALEKPGLNKDLAEWSVINQIKRVYQEATKKYAEDGSLNDSYIRFCIKIDSKADVVDWCMYFLWEDVTNKAIWDTLSDLYFNESDIIKSAMWVIMSDFGAKYISEIINKKTDSLIDGGKKLRDLFNSAFTYIRCSYFHISLLDQVKDEDIMKELLNDFKQNVFMWNALAQRLWRVDIKAEPGVEAVRSPKTRLEQSVIKYKEGIACLLPENKSGLWCILINFLFFIYEDKDNAISTSFKIILIKTHLIEGMPYFSENQFLKWLNLETDLGECMHIAEKAVAILPKSVKLWRQRLKYEFCKDDTQNARSLFHVAIGHLQENSLPLWIDMVQHTVLRSGQDSLNDIYWEGSSSCVEVSSKIRPMFLEWLALRKGIKNARAMYNLLVEKEPNSREMHVMMSKLENTLAAEDFDEVIAERVHKIACIQFQDDVEVWLNYIKFLLGLNIRGVRDIGERVSITCDNGLATLPTHLHDEFKLKYNEMIRATK